MPLQPIVPKGDSRIEHKTAVLNGSTYHYLYGVPQGRKFKQTVFLVSTYLYLAFPIDVNTAGSWMRHVSTIAFARIPRARYHDGDGTHA